MNVEPVDFGGELRKAIEPRLAPAPIILFRPIAADVLDPFQRRALAPVLDQFGFRPARVAQPRFEIVEHVVADRNAIGFDFSAHERPFSKPSRSCRDGFHRRKSSSHARPISREVRESSEFNVLQQTFGKGVDDLHGAAAIDDLKPFRRTAIPSTPPRVWSGWRASFAHALEVLRIFLTGRAGSTDQKKILQSPINFVRIAYRTNSAVDETLSLRIADARWVSTVFTLRFKTAPTDLLVCPSAIN